MTATEVKATILALLDEVAAGSDAATDAIAGADELAVAGISWYELAWLAAHERIVVTIW